MLEPHAHAVRDTGDVLDSVPDIVYRYRLSPTRGFGTSARP